MNGSYIRDGTSPLAFKQRRKTMYTLIGNLQETFSEREPLDPTKKFTVKLLCSYAEFEKLPTELEGWEYFWWEAKGSQNGGIVVEFTLARENI